ncbi:MAG: phosphatase, partial [Gluconacetobacter diazotrophicus]|nr:phosphatase [Gluconacetobacter diazotrophicus]
MSDPPLPRRAIPANRALRVIGDVHGDLSAFSHAVATD